MLIYLKKAETIYKENTIIQELHIFVVNQKTIQVSHLFILWPTIL